MNSYNKPNTNPHETSTNQDETELFNHSFDTTEKKVRSVILPQETDQAAKEIEGEEVEFFN